MPRSANAGVGVVYSDNSPMREEKRLPSLDEREVSTSPSGRESKVQNPHLQHPHPHLQQPSLHGRAASPNSEIGPQFRNRSAGVARRPAIRQPPAQPSSRSPSPAFLTDVPYEFAAPGSPPPRPASRSSGFGALAHHQPSPDSRPNSRMSLYYPDRPSSRQSTLSVDSFRSLPVAPLGGSRPLWATISERQASSRRRSATAATKYGHLPAGTSQPAAFSAAIPKGGKIPEGLQNVKPKEMPRLVDVVQNHDGTRDVGMQAAPCMWTRFFFETPQDKDLSSHVSTPNFQHFDVTFQPDPLGPIDMSNPMAGRKAGSRHNTANKNIREWIQKSHESVFLITQVLPPDTFVDIDNVRELRDSGERDVVWPLPAPASRPASPTESNGEELQEEERDLVSLVEYTRTVCRMEPRSTDDARQLIKLQRGVLTAVVTVMNEIEQRYEERYNERCEEMEEEYRAKTRPIEAENSRLKTEMADYLEVKRQLMYLDRVEAELGETKRKLHQTEDALQDALAKLAGISALESKNAELAAEVAELAKQLQAMTKAKNEEQQAKMIFKFEVATLRKIVDASKNKDELERMVAELERLRMDNNELSVVNERQEEEIERLTKLLETAEEKQRRLEAELAAARKSLGEHAGMVEDAARLAAALKSAEAAARLAKLTARMLGAHTAASGQGELIPCSVPNHAIATLPAGFQDYGSPVEVFLHKRMRVSLPADAAKPSSRDGSSEDASMRLLRPGESATAEELATATREAPTEGMAQRASTLLADLPADDYTWVKLPMGAVVEAEGVEGAKCLLLPGTTVLTRGELPQNVDLPPASSLALPYHVSDEANDGNSDGHHTHELRLPKGSLVNCGDSCSDQPMPRGAPDELGRLTFDVPGGCAFTIGKPVEGDERRFCDVTVPPGTVLTLAVDNSSSNQKNTDLNATQSSRRWKGIAELSHKCLWCSLRTGDDDSDTEESSQYRRRRRPSSRHEGRGGTISFREPELDCTEDCGTLRVFVCRTGDTAEGPAEVIVSSRDGSANEVVDYVPIRRLALRWEDGDVEDKVVEVSIVDDDFTQEDDEDFYVVIESVSVGDLNLGISECCITIKDSDKPRPKNEKIGDPLDPTQLAWEVDSHRVMNLPKSWKKMLGKHKIDGSKMMTLEKCRKLIFQLYATKRNADQVDDRAGNNRAFLDDYTSEFLKNYLGMVGLGKKLAEFLARLRYEYRRKTDAFVCQFVCLVGLYDPQPHAAHFIVVKGLDMASSLCTATGCNPAVFWTQMHKGRRVTLRLSEAHAFLDAFLHIKDSQGRPYVSPEVDLAQVQGFLDDVIAAQAAKSSSTAVRLDEESDCISLDRFMAFLVSTTLWLNSRAAPRVAQAFRAFSSSADGQLDYRAARDGIMSLLAWNEASNLALFKHALQEREREEGVPPDSEAVSVDTMVKAVYDQHDVVCFTSVS